MFSISAVVVKNKSTGKILQFESIDDCYCEVCVEYPNELVSIQDLIDYGVKVYGQGRAFQCMASYLDKHQSGGLISFQCEARHLPNIGDVEVSIETREISEKEWLSFKVCN